MLEVAGVRKTFGDIQALENVNLSIEKGQVHSLIGPNGSGKTTLVKIIAGLLAPDGGIVRVDGHDISRQPVETKKVIGYIPDEPVVWPAMTGEEFLHFTGALFDIPLKEREVRIKELLGLFHLQGIEKERFGQYSRGSKQKFSILAALLHHPKLLLIDEPIVGLDPQSAGIAKKAFAAFAKEGGAVLLVTHTLSAAQELSDVVTVVKGGRVLMSGSIDDMRQRAQLAPRASFEKIYEAITK